MHDTSIVAKEGATCHVIQQKSHEVSDSQKATLHHKNPAVVVFLHATAMAASPTALPCESPLSLLFAALAKEFSTVKATGMTIGRNQPAASFAGLDTRIRGLIGSYMSGGHTDWKKYVGFNPAHYVRHLIDDNEDFELMLICWCPGQASRVHNHGDSHCYLTLMDGTVEELRYDEEQDTAVMNQNPEGNGGTSSPPKIPGVLGTHRPCPILTPTGVSALTAGTTAYINDNMGLHAVRCPGDCPAPGAVTLHLYSPPIKRVKLYEPDVNRVVYRTPGFFTVRGEKN